MSNKTELAGLSSIFLFNVQEGKVAYRFDVDIQAFEGQKRPRNLTKGAGVVLNRRACTELVKLALAINNWLPPNEVLVYDGKEILYTSVDFVPNCETWIENAAITPIIRQCGFDGRNTRFLVIISQCEGSNRVLDLTDIHNEEATMLTAIGQEDHSLRTFFEMAVAQEALESGQHMSLGAGRLYKREPLASGGGYKGIINFHAGVCKGVKIVEGVKKSSADDHVHNSLALVLDAKIHAFVKQQTVDEAIKQFMRNVQRTENPGKKDWEECVKFFKYVKVQVKYNKTRTFSIGGFGQKPLAEEGFEKVEVDGTSKHVSIISYLLSQYRVKVQNGNYPGVYMLGKPNELFPAEQLLILEGQKVPVEKQTPDLTDLLLKNNTVKPEERLPKIEASGQALGLWNGSNRVLRVFGIKVHKESNDCKIDVRPLPKLIYKNKEAKPEDFNGDWSRGSGTFVEPKASQNWVYIFDEAEKATVDQFIDVLVRQCQKKGMPIRKEDSKGLPHYKRLVNSRGVVDPDQWKVAFQWLADKNVDFCLFIDSKQFDSHGLLKLFEVFGRATNNAHKLLTQQITIEVVKHIVSPRGAAQTLDNIINKLNVKFGGLNYCVEMPIGKIAQHECRFKIADGNLLVIGYDVSHPKQKTHLKKSQSTAAAAAAARSNEGNMEPMELNVSSDDDEDKLSSTEPSVVGFCANIAPNPHSFVGDYFFQQSRREAVDVCELKARAKWMLWCLDTNRPRQNRPAIVFVLRDGLSEGQYNMAYKEELKAIRAGFQEHDASYEPKFVLVIGTKRHFKKFFVDKEEKIQNMPPGSIIQSKIVRPDILEFYLQCHFPVQGTGKAVEYAMLYNNVQIPQKDLLVYLQALGIDKEKITKDEAHELLFKRSLYSLLLTLCFSHQIVNKPISLPEPVYQADELAKRGRYNYETLKAHYPDDLPLLANGKVDNCALTNMLSYWGNGTVAIKNRFTA